MANALYTPAKAKLSARTINLTTDTIKAVLVDLGAYTFSAAHEFLSDIPSAARIGTPQALAGKSEYFGFFDANDVTFSAVAAGSGTANAIEAVALYKDTGTVGTSSLIGIFDTGPSGAISLALNGGDVSVTWPAGGILNV